MNSEKNIVLTGMPASGKSTAGVIFAKIMGMDFIDSDILIQNQTGHRLSEIIENDGIDNFINTENRVNSTIEAANSVIATGGSAVYGKEAMQHFKKIGIICYLRVGFEELEQRLHDIRQRGVVIREGQTLRSLYEERTALYEKYADIIIDEDGKNVETVVAELVDKIAASHS